MVAIALLVVMFIIGMPNVCDKEYLDLWHICSLPLSCRCGCSWSRVITFMLLGMIIGAVVGVIAEHPTMKLNAFSGFNVDGSYLFPTLFVTIACGAVSGFHSLVSSGTSKTISNEKDMPMVGYAMVVESLLGVIALVVVGAVAVNGTKLRVLRFPFSTVSVIFSKKIRYSGTGCHCIYDDVCICTGTDLFDSVARIGRMSFQELFYGDTTDTSKMPGWQKVLTNKYFGNNYYLILGYLLTWRIQ